MYQLSFLYSHNITKSFSFAEYRGLAGVQRVPIRERHIFALASLTRREESPPHKDSFDRMLICQAAVENMMFVTHDSLIPGYDEPRILAV